MTKEKYLKRMANRPKKIPKPKPEIYVGREPARNKTHYTVKQAMKALGISFAEADRLKNRHGWVVIDQTT